MPAGIVVPLEPGAAQTCAYDTDVNTKFDASASKAENPAPISERVKRRSLDCPTGLFAFAPMLLFTLSLLLLIAAYVAFERKPIDVACRPMFLALNYFAGFAGSFCSYSSSRSSISNDSSPVPASPS
jgi:hypothetical protein